ncbi:AAA domain-containing protein [uncultured Brachyspira sp.]|uniref:AAA domain-containing protein n=1 Tax=uncultured Brachyspira sp. TaxID=221953 RepID=UPI0027DCAA80|nr:AAA domain-containing protein [uncultured Brachyspira sp.]
MDKILGIYEVVERISDNEFICKKGIQKFNITKILKDDKESIYSHKAQNLSSIQHKNLINISIDEDEKYFYAIREELEPQEFDKLDTSIFLEYSEDIRYQKLIECYLQIFEAIKYIHSQGLYHGNINTDNVLVNRQNEVFLLDFGKSYFYGLLGYDNTRFHSPEQLGFIKCDIDSKTDIFSFGLCMLKLLVGIFEDFNFLQYYNTPDDLHKIFKDIENDYELNDIDNDLFVLIKKMTVMNPNDRIPLSDLGQELINILSKTRKTYCFEINLQPKVAQDYREIHDITITKVIDDIESKIEKGKSYWSFGLDKEGNREEIKIACGDFIFCCSTREGHYLFCFRILENQKEFDKLYSNGVEFHNDFSITIGGNHNSKCDNVQNIKDELKERFELQKLRNKYLEIDKKAIATEEELLIAEKKTIEQKKNSKLALLKSIDKGSDTITFEFIPPKNKRDDIEDDENGAKENDIDKKDRDFKPKDKVLIEEKDKLNSRTIYGEVSTLKPDKKDIVINVGKYKATNLKMDKNKIYQISYDFQVEEILWNKKNKALEELKNGNAQIPNIMRKINEPKELQPNTLIEIEKFFDEMLDENQKEAVIKTMSLDNGSEILLIQGPPGTGKTTTITEMLLQLLDRHRHWKILVASQSNQAVDNVLEKVCQKEEKILRIGNREEAMSDIARQFTPERVLNKLIKDNIDRISKNPIEEDFKHLQEGFAKSLQSITDKLSRAKDSKENKLATLFTKNIRLIFGTLLGISSWNNFRDIAFDIAIVDEAGRATLSELLVPCLKARKIVLVGDHKQLAPVIDDEIASNLNKEFTKKEVATSFFERLFKRLEEYSKEDRYLNGEASPSLVERLFLRRIINNMHENHIEHFKHRLIYNYRAEDKICQLYNQPFYDGELKTSQAIEGKREHNLSIFNSSVVWINTNRRSDKRDKQVGTGKINRCNALLINSILYKLKDDMQKYNLKHSIGIITPYRAQTNLLKDILSKIKKEFKDFYQKNSDSNQDKDLRNGFDIGTVDSFQGSDRDIIIYDCVRSGGRIDFIADEKRLNVSLSRAKKLLIIVGDMEFLYSATVSEGENPFNKIVYYIDRNKDKCQIIDANANTKGEKNG